MTDSSKPETDVIVIGSGIGGLSCAALLARYGFDVTVIESYSLPGGAAHSFERNGFKFDSGPSLYSGLSYRPSSNPSDKCWMPLERNCHARHTIHGDAVCQKAILTLRLVPINFARF